MRRAGWVAALLVALLAVHAEGRIEGEEGGNSLGAEARDAAGGVVLRILELAHFSGKTLDEVEETAWENFADQVDPNRLFISRDSIEAVRGRLRAEGGVRGDISSGDYSGPKELVKRAGEVGERFLEGSWSVQAQAHGRVPLIWETMARSKSDADLEGRWRLFLHRKKIRGEAESYEDIADLAKAPRRLGENEIRDIFLDAIAGAFDPNSEYQRPYRKETFANEMSLTSTTTGVEVVREEDGRVVVKEGPEEVKPGSEVVGVGQEGKGIVKTEDLSTTQLEEMVGGGGGGGAQLQVAEEGGETRIVEVEAEDDPANNARKPAATLVHRSGRRVGIVSVPALYGWGSQDSGGDFRRLVSRLRDCGAQAIVIDLRGNGGGSIDEAREMAGTFIGQAPVAMTLDRTGGVRTFLGAGDIEFRGVVVCLVDAETGSGAEILAGALQHHGVGVVVGGGKTRGKGTAQAVLDLADHGYLGAVPDGHLGGVRVSTMLIHTPGGKAIQGHGISPDITLPCGMEVAKVVGAMRGTAEKPYGSGNLDTVDTGGFRGRGWRTAVRAAGSLSQKRTATDPFFLRMQKLVNTGLGIIKNNSVGESGAGAAEKIRALHGAMVEGRTPARTVMAEDVTGPEKWELERRLIDPYEEEAVAIALDLASSALPESGWGVKSPHE